MELESELVCPVCLDKIGKINCSVTECNHTFHTSCLLQCNGLCPLCRADMVKDTDVVHKFQNRMNDETSSTLFENYIQSEINQLRHERHLLVQRAELHARNYERQKIWVKDMIEADLKKQKKHGCIIN